MFLQPDISQTKRFLTALCGSDDTVENWQVFKNSPDCEAEPTWRRGTFSAMSSWLQMRNQLGCGVYIMANEGSGRKAENVSRVRAIFVDLDGAPLEPVLNAPLEAHIIVETSPGRYQAFWKTDNLELTEFSLYQAALADRYNGDHSIIDLPRVVRLPGYYHRKEQPFLVRIIHVSEHAPFSKRELLSGLQLIPKPNGLKTPSDYATDHSQPIPEGARNNVMCSIAARLRNAGLDFTEILEDLQAINLKRCEPPLSDDHLVRIAKWADGKGKLSTLRPQEPPAWLAKEQEDHDYSRETLPQRQNKTAEQVSKRLLRWTDLQDDNLPSIRWVITDLLPEGLCILAGRPKVGKSWFAAGIGLAVATGGLCLGRFAVSRGDALILSLEDSTRRFRSRVEAIAAGAPLPSNAWFANQWPTLPEAIEDIEEWVADVEHPRLVVIDTFARIRQQSADGNSYERDYRDMALLQSVAIKHRIAILVVHHTRKAEAVDALDAVSGTHGISGAADTIWILSRADRLGQDGELFISGRDMSDRELALTFSERSCQWLYAGTPSQRRDTKNQQAVLDYLATRDGGVAIKELVENLSLPTSSIKRVINKLQEDGLVRRVVGTTNQYTLITKDES